jgi:acetate CoA/acetoacetate CoA-transferase beta subunit
MKAARHLDDLVAMIPDGATLMIGGFFGVGSPHRLIQGLVAARRVIVAMTHTTKGVAKVVEECTMPLTSVRPVSLVVTEMAVIEPTAEGLVLRERAPGVSVADVVNATAAKLIIPPTVPEYALS